MESDNTSIPTNRPTQHTFHLNGKEVAWLWPEGRNLLDILRDELRLTGAKRGCDSGNCGLCTVLVDGKARNSCTLTQRDVLGRAVTTIEGLAQRKEDGSVGLDPLQEAFVACAGFQCGICTPGLILTAKALLAANPSPTREELRKGLSRALCRCTGYEQIFEAVERATGLRQNTVPSSALQILRNVQGVLKSATSEVPQTRVIGKNHRKYNGEDFVTGRALYSADVMPVGIDPRQFLHGATVRSPHPHARIRSIDSREATALPGVHSVFTAADIPGSVRYGKGVVDQYHLATGKVRHIGEPVVLVFAKTKELARLAAEKVHVAYEPLPAVFEPEEALAEGAPQVHDGGNLLSEFNIRRGDVEAAFREAHCVVEGEYSTPPQDHVPLELEAAIAYTKQDAGVGKVLHVVSSGQHVFYDKLIIMKALRLGKDQVVVRQPAIGASYGKREDPHCQVHAALGAWLTGRPCKIEWTRAESLQCSSKRTRLRAKMRLALDESGRITGFDADLLGDAGAYASWSRNIMRKAAVLAFGPNAGTNIRITARAAYTNNPMSGPIRGFGAVETAFCTESLMDAAAARMGLDPLEFRCRNVLRSGDRTSTGQQITGPLLARDAMTVAWRRLHRFKRPAPRDGILVGRGLALMWYGIGFGTGLKDAPEASIELLPDGSLLLAVGTVDYGNGSNTTFRLLAAEALGVEPECIEVVSADTSRTKNCGSTVASKQTFTTGNAVLAAASDLRRNFGEFGGSFQSLQERRTLYGRAASREMTLRGEGSFAHHDLTTALDADGQGVAWNPIAWGAQAAEVAVNTRTGQLDVRRIIAVHYLGKVLNPAGVRGQIIGGLSMGLGYARREDARFLNGSVQADSLARYRLLRAREVPDLRIIALEDPDPNGPYGAIGIGEPPTVPTAAAIANAVRDAIGVAPQRLPLTPEYVLELLAKSDRS